MHRRDFLNGVAVAIGSQLFGASGKLLAAMQESAGTTGPVGYPPAWGGIRGATDDMVSVGHGIAWQGTEFVRPERLTDKEYDLVVVGAGVSGLAAAIAYRKRIPSASVLILDNHDDFGGHARRLEIDVDGRLLITKAGSETLVGRAHWLEGAPADFLREIGIAHVDDVMAANDLGFAERHGLSYGVRIPDPSAENGKPAGTYIDPVTISVYGPALGGDGRDTDEALAFWEYVRALVWELPLSEAGKQELYTLLLDQRADVYPELSAEERIVKLAGISYLDFLREQRGVGDEVRSLLAYFPSSSNISWDAIPALLAARDRMPGFGRIETKTWVSDLGPYASMYTEKQIDESVEGYGGVEFTHQLPGGNGDICRLAVRKLIPAAAPGDSLEDSILARFDYGKLDVATNSVRLRLNSTVVDARNREDGKGVDVVYLQNGETHRVRGRHAVMACWNNILPSICPEMPPSQKQALKYAEKYGLVYVTVALRNWKAVQKSGLFGFWSQDPDAFYWMGELAQQVSLGGYEAARTPDDPIAMRLYFRATEDNPELSERERLRLGRYKVFQHSFEEYETEARKLLESTYGESGFSWDEDVAAVVVHRWPHGVAYGYNTIFDPEPYTYKDGPHVQGRQPIGRIAIANSDSEAQGILQYGVIAAYRAVDELLGT